VVSKNKHPVWLLQDAKHHREDLGVEMYGMQQQLARVQRLLQQSQHSTAELANLRQSDEQNLSQLRNALAAEEKLTLKERNLVRQ